MNLKELWHRLGSPRWFYQISAPLAWVLGVLALLLLLAGTAWGLAFAPPDYQQGDSFRIIYVHVPAAIVAQSAYMLMGAAGVVLLVWRMKMADIVIRRHGAVRHDHDRARPVQRRGLGQAHLGRLVGVGRPYHVGAGVAVPLHRPVRAAPGHSAPGTAGRACAVLAIVGTINIPIIKYSVDWWLTLHQGATFTLTRAPAMPASMWLPLLVNVLGVYCFFGANLVSRVRVEILERERNTQWVQELVRQAA